MNDRSENKPNGSREIASAQDLSDRKNSRKCGQIPWVQILVQNVEASPRDRKSQECCHQCNGGPASLLIFKESRCQAPGCDQHQQDRGELQQEKNAGQRQMSNPHQTSDQVRKQRVSGVLAKEIGIAGIQARMQDFQDSRKINLRVFGVGMVALDQKCDGGKQEQTGDASKVSHWPPTTGC